MDHHCFGSGHYSADHCSTGAMLQTLSAYYYKTRLWPNHRRLWLNIQHFQELKLCVRQIMTMVVFFLSGISFLYNSCHALVLPSKIHVFIMFLLLTFGTILASVDVFRTFQHRALTFFLSLYTYNMFLISLHLPNL